MPCVTLLCLGPAWFSTDLQTDVTLCDTGTVFVLAATMAEQLVSMYAMLDTSFLLHATISSTNGAGMQVLAANSFGQRQPLLALLEPQVDGWPSHWMAMHKQRHCCWSL